ncbi:MAG: GatB/YqeY domain-containing protein [Bacteroidales bacterium]|nr:GatB/YqeY domain-containing protein [Candidatus Equimonas enterica]
MLFDQINTDIKEAMKARDKVRLATLRNIKKYFLEAKTAPGAGDDLADDAALRILQKLAKQGRESAATFSQQGRQDLADDEMAQVAVIEAYLPKPLSETEIEVAVAAIIAEVGATSMKDMGRVMGLASRQMAGRAEGGAISAVVKRLLAAQA